jgi:Arc/MetJ-type ribon-helix-helix transcriptional regulator
MVMNTTCKATFVLPTSLLEELRQFVKDGLAVSLSSLVRQSLEVRARQLRESQLASQFEEAAKDPLFMADLRESMVGFDGLNFEGLDG